MEDIKIKSKINKFKFRVSAIIIQDNKLLVSSTKKRGEYVFPGGHVELGEATQDAILREVKEEIDLDVEIINLFCISEKFYINRNNKVAQEINFYYRLNTTTNISEEEFTIKEMDKGVEKEHTFKLIPISTLENIPLKPLNVVKLLIKQPDSINNILVSDERETVE